MDAHLTQVEHTLTAQDGLVTLTQLRDGAVRDDVTRSLLRRRVLRRVRPRVFGLVGARDSWERGLLAVVLSVEGAVASHSAAARLWAFDPRPEDRYEVTIERPRRVNSLGVTVHRSGKLEDQDTSRRNGIACTSFERTLADCTTLLNEAQLGRALDNGLRRGLASLQRLRRCAERLESGPGRHMSVIRALLAERGVGFDPGGSRSELELLAVWRRAGLPGPVQQFRIRVGSQTFRPDFAWPDEMVLAEYYGLPFHTGASAVVSDSRRLTALTATGWLPLVFTSESTEREIVERTTGALNRCRDG